jgi:hypothetical protein
MDARIGDAAFMDATVGNGWATRDPERAANGVAPEPVEVPD